MDRLEHISIRVAGFDEMLTGQAEAVLTEAAEMLGRLLAEGVEDSIDLRGLPLTAADRDWLDGQLGRGEAEIVLQAGGRSLLKETAYPGLWRVVHEDLSGRVVAEFLETAFVPVILRPDKSDVEKGHESLLLKLETQSREREDGA